MEPPVQPTPSPFSRRARIAVLAALLALPLTMLAGGAWHLLNRDGHLEALRQAYPTHTFAIETDRHSRTVSTSYWVVDGVRYRERDCTTGTTHGRPTLTCPGLAPLPAG